MSTTQGGEPFVAELSDERGRPVGYFTGLITSRYGARILGSPFPGWHSGPMGFNLDPAVSRRGAIEALVAYAFGPLRCLHVELLDRQLGPRDVADMGFRSVAHRTYGIDLRPDEDAIFAAMNKHCRKAIRKSQRLGVTVEEATGDGFAEEHYAQLVDVFARQALTPRVDTEDLRELLRRFEATGRILLLRARNAEGDSIATGIFLGLNDVAYSWGGASWRTSQELRPNEALTWHAIRVWKAKGARVLDLGGGTDEGWAQYKRKFGPDEHVVPYLRKSRFAAVAAARSAAERVHRRACLSPPLFYAFEALGTMTRDVPG